MFFFNLINCLDSNILLESQRLYNNEQINLKNCFFSRTNIYKGLNSNEIDLSGPSGGIIFCYLKNLTLLINECIFYQCKSNSFGGAIFYLCNTNQISGCELFKVCGIESSCSNSGVFAYLCPHSTKKNNIEFVSITNCGNTGAYAIEFMNGIQKLNSFNSSNNNLPVGSGIIIEYSTSFYGCFCTFSNNHAISYICIYIFGGQMNKTLINSNIVNNDSPNGHGIINVNNNGHFEIIKCYFLNNLNKLFSVTSNSLFISNCTISHSSNDLIIGNVNTLNIFLNIIFSTYLLNHFSTFLCKAENPKIFFISKTFKISNYKLLFIYLLTIIN